MARLYSNENFPLRVVAFLRDLGHDVLTTQDAGQSGIGIPDDEVLQFAIAEERAVLTLNRRDFIRLHRENEAHFGIVVCTENIDFENLALRIHEVVASAQSLENQLLRVYKDG